MFTRLKSRASAGLNTALVAVLGVIVYVTLVVHSYLKDRRAQFAPGLHRRIGVVAARLALFLGSYVVGTIIGDIVWKPAHPNSLSQNLLWSVTLIGIAAIIVAGSFQVVRFVLRRITGVCRYLKNGPQVR